MARYREATARMVAGWPAFNGIRREKQILSPIDAGRRRE